MTGRLQLEIRKRRGQAKAAAILRRSAVQEHARVFLREILDRLEGHDAEFAFEVLRALIRAAGAHLVRMSGQSRAVGVFVGALTNVAPAWKSEQQARREAADALFDKGRA